MGGHGRTEVAASAASAQVARNAAVCLDRAEHAGRQPVQDHHAARTRAGAGTRIAPVRPDRRQRVEDQVSRCADLDRAAASSAAAERVVVAARGASLQEYGRIAIGGATAVSAGPLPAGSAMASTARAVGNVHRGVARPGPRGRRAVAARARRGAGCRGLDIGAQQRQVALGQQRERPRAGDRDGHAAGDDVIEGEHRDVPAGDAHIATGHRQSVGVDRDVRGRVQRPQAAEVGGIERCGRGRSGQKQNGEHERPRCQRRRVTRICGVRMTG